MTEADTGLSGSMCELDGLMELVATGLSAHGFDVRLPEWEDSYRLRVSGPDVRYDLTVNDCGYVELDCSPRPPEDADPKQIADIVTALLTGPSEDYLRKGNGYGNRALTFKAIVASELKARGLSVDLDAYADEECYDAYAVIVVTSPETQHDTKATVSDQGELIWERDYWPDAAGITWKPEYSGRIVNPQIVADDITETVSRAMALASACAGDGNG